MEKLIFRYVLRFLLLVIIQVFVLNKIQLSGYINPYAYIFFILTLPFDTPRYLMLFLAFFLGLSIDIFLDSSGMHTSATLLIAFMRPWIINAISIKKEFEPKSFPDLHNMDTRWILLYSIIMVFIHHTFLFFLEVLSFSNLFSILSQSIISSFITFILIIICFMLESKQNKRI